MTMIQVILSNQRQHHDATSPAAGNRNKNEFLLFKKQTQDKSKKGQASYTLLFDQTKNKSMMQSDLVQIYWFDLIAWSM
jgi:hypothetical protein